MKKGKSITLLSILCFVMAVLLVMTFVRFPVGTKNYNSVIGAIETDYDIAGGTAYTLTLVDDGVEVIENDEQAKDVVNTLKYRMDALGYQTYTVKSLKVNDDYSIRIEAKALTNEYGEADVATLTSDIGVVAKYGELKFYGGSEANPTTELFTDIKNPIKSAKSTGYNSLSEAYICLITFSDEAYSELAKNMESGAFYFKVTLGEEALSPFDGSSELSSTYFSDKSIGIQTTTEAGAKQEALQIMSGGLAYEFKVSEGEDVSSPYGENVGLICEAVILAVLVLSIVALTVLYKGYGIVAGLTLVAFMLIDLLMLIAVPNIILSIGGVIGILLSLILAIDGQVILVRRIKEEHNEGKMLKPAIKTAFKRATMPIVNSSVVSEIVALLVIAFSKGALRNFGITLAIGTVISIFATMLLTKMFLTLVLNIKGYKDKFLNLKENEKAVA